MITKELLKDEINKVHDKYYFILYKIMKSFEDDSNEKNYFKKSKIINDENKNKRKKVNKKEWHDFIDNTAGSLKNFPITRDDQGNFEIREEF